ncbi:uncharacterized protein BDZ99DRAFT_460608 [Mytilinidion resinicola]|uniref:Uncharacterized protein n=1 Tax=Mytilinidion resinicola TaxID=574789 RepID=A0A6A6YZK8_9PEZI|nr:uncharacterized protein BDZ99DRAFT_460608 [Mytilinidion resinicola]KAF2813355.1 hypothetical protein BDZ99DRAFT_460608 [Mytilinidion resinicola]
MASSTSIPRILLPRAQLLRPHTRLFRPTLLLSARHASSKDATKPIVLEKPEKFNPPSHGRRLPKAKPKSYGPELTATQKEMMARKKYPHMMPPKNSFLYKFLHDRWIHTWISLGILLTLGSWAFYINFITTTPYADLVPTRADFKSHPIDSFFKFIEVYKMHVAYVSAQTAERRRKNVEDVTKRAEYRKAHGLDQNQGFGGWTAKSDDEMLGPGLRAADRIVAAEGDGASPVAGEDRPAEAAYKKPLKKWLGIW